MTIFTRAVLEKAFPNNPRVVAAFETLDTLLSAVDADGQTFAEKIDAINAELGDDSKFQGHSSILDALSGLPNRVGVPEFTNDGSANIRPIDGQDPASLVSRGVGYTVYVGIGGAGTTAQRPVVPLGYGAIYFDTTLLASGKPIFLRPDGAWVDSSGTVV